MLASDLIACRIAHTSVPQLHQTIRAPQATTASLTRAYQLRWGVALKFGGHLPSLTCVAEKKTMQPPPSVIGSAAISGAQMEHAA
eukprot:854227-Prymnesium_polylepis.4